jgi:hypothetical protein
MPYSSFFLDPDPQSEDKHPEAPARDHPRSFSPASIMATKYKATIERECWKQHVCLGCGSNFRYRMRRKRTTQGPTERIAEENARKAIAAALKDDVDLQPCPTCGLVQPDMVGDAQATGHGLVLIILVILMGMVLIVALIASTGTAAVPWIGVGLCFLGVLAHYWIARRNPNKDLEANRTKAEAEIQKGTLKLEKAGHGGPTLDDSPARPKGGSRAPAFLLMLLGIALLPSAEVMRLASGWPRNHNCEPMVIGPGDQPTLYLPSKVKSIKGLWNAQPAVTVVNAEEVGLADARLDSSSRNRTWGGVIFGKSVRAEDSQLWTKVELPSDETLAGKTIQLRINMDVKFPAERGHGFEDEEKSFEDSFELHLASPRAGRTYRLLWWGGGLGGGILVLLGSIWLMVLASKAKKAALPSKAIPLEEEEAEAPEQALPAEDDDEPQEVLPAE